MFGSDIRDKDGVAASVSSPDKHTCDRYTELSPLQMMFVELVTSLHARGQTASGLLEELYQRSVVCSWARVPKGSDNNVL